MLVPSFRGTLTSWRKRTTANYEAQRETQNLGKSYPRHQHWLETDHLESSFAEGDPRLLVATSTLGWIRRSITGMLRQVILPLCLALVEHIWSAGSSSGLPRTYQSCKGPQMTKGLQQEPYEKLRELGLFRLEKRRLRDQSNQCALNIWSQICLSCKRLRLPDTATNLT